jgi:hypothetical protein
METSWVINGVVFVIILFLVVIVIKKKKIVNEVEPSSKSPRNEYDKKEALPEKDESNGFDQNDLNEDSKRKIVTEATLSQERLKKLMQMHHHRIIEQYATTPGFEVMKPLWDKLLAPEILDYAANGLLQEIQFATEDGAHSYQAKNLSSIYVAVSAVPSANLQKAQSIFNPGYLDFFGQLMKESGYSQSGIDLAHWIFCFDNENQSMHLTFLGNTGIPANSGISMLALDLMSEKEKRALG